MNEVLPAVLWDEAEHSVCQVTVRVEQGKAFTGEHVLTKHGREQRRLAHAGLPDRVEVVPAVGSANAKGHARVAEGGATEIRDARVVELHPFSFSFASKTTKSAIVAVRGEVSFAALDKHPGLRAKSRSRYPGKMKPKKEKRSKVGQVIRALRKQLHALRRALSREVKRRTQKR